MCRCSQKPCSSYLHTKKWQDRFVNKQRDCLLVLFGCGGGVEEDSQHSMLRICCRWMLPVDLSWHDLFGGIALVKRCAVVMDK